jgi:hypothetical protein
LPKTESPEPPGKAQSLCDIKISSDRLVKVLDFGLAKLGGTPTAPASHNSPTVTMEASNDLTRAGVILGTAADGKRFLIEVAPGQGQQAPQTPITVVLNWQADLKK